MVEYTTARGECSRDPRLRRRARRARPAQVGGHERAHVALRLGGDDRDGRARALHRADELGVGRAQAGGRAERHEQDVDGGGGAHCLGRRRAVEARDLAAEARGAHELDRAQRRGALDEEGDAVALLDGQDGRVLAAPRERPDDREPGRDPGDLRRQEGQAAGDDGARRPAATGGSSRRRPAGARASSSPPWRRPAGARSAARPGRGGRGRRRSARRRATSPRVTNTSVESSSRRGAGDRQHGQRGRGSRAEQDGRLEQVDEPHYPASASSSARIPCGPFDDEVGLRGDLVRRLLVHARRRTRPARARPPRRARAAPGTRRGRSGRRPRRAPRRCRFRAAAARCPCPCASRRAGGPRGPCAPSGSRSRPPRRARRARARPPRRPPRPGAPRQWKAAIASLSSPRTRSSCSSGRPLARGELLHALRPRRPCPGRAPTSVEPPRSISAPWLPT